MMRSKEGLSPARSNDWAIADRSRLFAQRSAIMIDQLARQWRLSDSETRKQIGWRAITAPIWLGSEIPAPSVPSRRVANTGGTHDTPAGDWLDRRLRSLERRYGRAWVAAASIRGLWLGLAVVVVWVLFSLIGFASLPARPVIVGLPILGMVLGAACGVAIRPSAGRIVEMLDRTFRLDERLTTAVDTLRSPDDESYVTQLQLADAANTLDNIAADVPRPIHAPLREVWFLAVLLTALLTGLFAWVPGTPLPRVRDEAVPVFVSASERLTAQQELPTLSQPPSQAPTVSEVEQQAATSDRARSDLDILGGALKQHPSTSAAGDAIANGDYRGAADIIRGTAGDADSMSEEERNALADDLDASADQMSAANPELAAATRKAADDLRGGGAQSGDGLLAVADEVDAAASEVVPQEELEQNLAEASDAQSGTGNSGEGANSEQGAESANQQDASQSESQTGNTDPGEGVAANPGVVEEQQPQPGAESAVSSGSQQGAASEGGSSGQTDAGSAPQEAGSGGSGAQGDQQGSEATGQQSSGSGEGDAAQSEASDPESTNEEAAQGTGAGSGSGSTNAESRSPEDEQVQNPASEGADPQANPDADGRGVDHPPPSSGDSGDGGGNSGTVRNNGDQSLPLQGTSDEGVQSGNQSGTSSTGSGAGQGTASGDGAQGSVGVAGPDSNIVPEDMRDAVGDYFDGTGAQP